MNWNAKFFSFMFVSWFQLSSRPIQKNPEKFYLLNPELTLGFGTRNVAQENRNPTKDWNPESKFHCHRMESSTWNPESAAWNPESNTVLDFLTWSDSRLIWPSYTISSMHKKVMVPHLSWTVPIFQWTHSQMNVVIVPLEIVPLTNLWVERAGVGDPVHINRYSIS